jgi:hypothetical protein
LVLNGHLDARGDIVVFELHTPSQTGLSFLLKIVHI